MSRYEANIKDKDIFKYELGEHVYEAQTNISGSIINRTEWGCGRTTYAIQPKSPDGITLPDYLIFDESFLSRVGYAPAQRYNKRQN